ncbi:DMP19 family protein [Mesorhizobium amorphae]|uniref:DMP19 family protein n=1 Tax=Mesorhizobium amorphae TaxID=71433 RepID=UPI001300C7DD|nr:DUF4375 domain-containing protein [Mesorhizobium amorphae]GLR43062.1 hypothetical protein GCM10007880_35780 [Mesorhizobium amorphae]
MFGFFSRKSKKTPDRLASNSGRGLKFGLPLPVVVPRSKVEAAGRKPFDLVFAVMQFATTMVSKGLYRYPEINPKAMQVYHAHWYSSEVKNGGHSQFIHNAGQEIDAMVANARAGLAASGAKGQLATLEKMSAWVAEHPDEAAKQTGFEGGRDGLLDTLDDAFYDADEAAPMDNLVARWIASWPDLQVVDDDDYDDAINQLEMANPSARRQASSQVGWRSGPPDVGSVPRRRRPCLRKDITTGNQAGIRHVKGADCRQAGADGLPTPNQCKGAPAMRRDRDTRRCL